MPTATTEQTVQRPAAAEQAVRESRARALNSDAARQTDRSNYQEPADETSATKAAIHRAIGDARRSVGEAIDVRLWTKKRPWIALGLAAGAGLVAAVAVRHGGKAESLKEQPPQPARPKPTSEEPAKGAWTGSLANSLFDLAKTAVETAIMTGVRETAARHFDNTKPSDEIVSHAE